MRAATRRVNATGSSPTANGLPVSGVKLRERHTPLSVEALEYHLGIERGKDRQRISRRRPVRDVPADRAPVLDLDPADLQRRRGKHRNTGPHRARPRDAGEGRERADREHIATKGDASQRSQAPQVEETGSRQRPVVECHEQVGGAGQWNEPRFFVQHGKRVAQRPGLAQLERGDGRPHVAFLTAR